MSAAKPPVPSTNAGHARETMSCIHDGHGTIGVMVMTATAAVAADDDSLARVIVSAIGSIAHGQVGRTTDRRVGDDGFRDDRLALDRVCRRRLAFAAMTGGLS